MAKNLIGPSLVDRKILDLFANGYTPNEVEEETYVPAATALQRARELLASIDLWDEIEQRRLLVHSMKKVKELMENADLTEPKLAQAYTNLLIAIDKTQEKVRTISEAEMEKLAAAQARQMIRLIEMSFSHARQLLSAEYPDVDLGKIDDAFYTGLRENTLEIEA